MKNSWVNRLNVLGAHQIPALFLLDFEGEGSHVWTLQEAQNEGFHFAIGQAPMPTSIIPRISAMKMVEKSMYEEAFQKVHRHLAQGNSFLVNLTASNEIELEGTLGDIYSVSAAKCKLWWEDRWVCFTPEPFVTIDEQGGISSYPMKGTAVRHTQQDEEALLLNPKELYEHTTIVDLIRNDISRVAHKVWVERFRYLEKIPTADGRTLMQLSSCIQGILPSDWKFRLGSLLSELLPAGSISGAPKPKTLEIIREAEKSLHPEGKRGYYTGIFGYFDGQTVQTFVLIRFIEQTSQGLFFKTGGGITYLSQSDLEYQELATKIYVPVL